VTQLDPVTQRNAARVEEGAAADDSPEHEAQGLVDAVAESRLGTAGARLTTDAEGSSRRGHAPSPAPGGVFGVRL